MFLSITVYLSLLFECSSVHRLKDLQNSCFLSFHLLTQIQIGGLS